MPSLCNKGDVPFNVQIFLFFFFSFLVRCLFCLYFGSDEKEKELDMASSVLSDSVCCTSAFYFPTQELGNPIVVIYSSFLGNSPQPL